MSENPANQFNHPDFYCHLKPGMTAWANDSVFEFEVISASSKKIVFHSKSDGVLINGKGVQLLERMDREIMGKIEL